MCLDSYLFHTTKEFCDDTTFCFFDDSNTVKIAYWMKNYYIHDIMYSIWISQGHPYKMTIDIPAILSTREAFNSVPLILSWNNLDFVEKQLLSGKITVPLSKKAKLLFNNTNTLNDDLELIKNAKSFSFLGLKIFYYSSW